MAAEKWINDNIGLIQKYQRGALFLMPQMKDTKYSSTVYNEQIAQGIRQKYSATANPYTIHGEWNPDSYLGELYKVAADATYYNSLAAHEAAQAYGYNPQEEQQWKAWLANFELQNPIWADYKNSGARDQWRTQTIAELNQIYANHEEPPGEMSQSVGQLLNAWNQFQATAVAAQTSGMSKTDLYNMSISWQDYLQTLMKQKPELTSVIQSVFLEAIPGGQAMGA
jgi:hypothetical protein